VPSNGTAVLNGSSNFLLEREQQTHNASLEYRYRPDNDLFDSQVLAYVNRVEMDEARVSDGRDDRTELDTLGLNINNTSRFQSGLGEIAVLYGIDAYRESFSARRSGDNRPLPPEAESDVWSLYTQARIPLAEAWRLDLGLRYDDFTTEAQNLNAAAATAQHRPRPRWCTRPATGPR
jgi:hemoglobin/transferrin/lactoferrin receptor protein